ncbi:MAG: 23S rRNA (guanosine(2251)-2'-O)-methyltransferase RlmB [Pseudohongiellaceae bacterium]|nr:23S rRNA (guanosine(2251)-2'-O)-methyltransferase RlmB [Pseudohongiellaceae bacterium]
MSNKEWVYGIHTVGELLLRHPQDVLELYIQQGREDKRINEVKRLADEAGVAYRVVDRRELDKRTKGQQGAVHQGVLALCKMGGQILDEKALDALLDGLTEPALILVLDEVTDPHNLGACLRTADAAGVDVVIVPKDRSAPLNMTARKVACGAANTMPFAQVTNLSRTLQSLKQRGIWLAGAAGEASQSVYEMDFSPSMAVIMGSEGKGLRRLTREHCDFLLSIPMAGALSSLNVSVATGVCLFEVVRQRRSS